MKNTYSVLLDPLIAQVEEDKLSQIKLTGESAQPVSTLFKNDYLHKLQHIEKILLDTRSCIKAIENQNNFLSYELPPLQ